MIDVKVRYPEGKVFLLGEVLLCKKTPIRNSFRGRLTVSIPDSQLHVSAETSDLLNPLNRSRKLGPSRRDVLTRLLGATGALGALQMLNAKEARADDLDDSSLPGGQIDPSLLNALRFDRENSADPGAVFLPDRGLLVGFGPNLYHCDTSTNTCRLFAKGRQVFKSSITEDVEDNIPALVVGTRGTVTQTAQDRFGRIFNSTSVVESITDVPDDFLITGNTQSAHFTGAFFKINVTMSTPQGEVAQIKTTCNLLTRSFPLGFNVTPGPLFDQPPDSIIDVNVARLLGIAGEIVEAKFGMLSDFLPTDLQEDFPWKKIFHHVIGTVFFCGLGAIAAGCAVAPGPHQVGCAVGAFLLSAPCSYYYAKLHEDIETSLSGVVG